MASAPRRSTPEAQAVLFVSDQISLAREARRRAASIATLRGAGAGGVCPVWSDYEDWLDVGACAVLASLVRRGRRTGHARDGEDRRRPTTDLDAVCMLLVEATGREEAARIVERVGIRRGRAEANLRIELAAQVTPGDVAWATLDARRLAAARRRRRFDASSWRIASTLASGTVEASPG